MRSGVLSVYQYGELGLFGCLVLALSVFLVFGKRCWTDLSKIVVLKPFSESIFITLPFILLFPSNYKSNSHSSKNSSRPGLGP